MFASLYNFLAPKQLILLSSSLILVSVICANLTTETYNTISIFCYILVGAGISLSAFAAGIIISHFLEEEDPFIDEMMNSNFSASEKKILKEIASRRDALNQIKDLDKFGGGKTLKNKEYYEMAAFNFF